MGEYARLAREVAATVAEAFANEAERTEWRRKWNAAGELLDEYGDEPVHTGKAKLFLIDVARRILAGYELEVAV